MRPKNLKTKLFLDSGDPDETKKMLDVMGFLDGQTTNPSLVAKKITGGVELKEAMDIHFSSDELLAEYKKFVTAISKLIPQGSVSIEVYADEHTTADAMLAQGREMF